MCVALQKTKKKEKEEKMKLPDKSSDNDDKCDCNDVSSEQNKRWYISTFTPIIWYICTIIVVKLF